MKNSHMYFTHSFMFTSLWKHYFHPGDTIHARFFALVNILVMLIATNAFISTFVMEIGIHWMQLLYAMLSTLEITSAMVRNTIQEQRLLH